MSSNTDKIEVPLPDETGNTHVQAVSTSTEELDGQHIPARSATEVLDIPRSYGGIVQQNSELLGDPVHAQFVNVMLTERDRTIAELKSEIASKDRRIEKLGDENTALQVQISGLTVENVGLRGDGIRKSLLATVGTAMIGIGITLFANDMPIGYSIGCVSVGAICLVLGWIDVRIGGKK